MPEPELVSIDLDGEERELMVLALNEYTGTAQRAYQVLRPVIGQSNSDEWYDLLTRLMETIEKQEPLV
jgi:hypothetical protein